MPPRGPLTPEVVRDQIARGTLAPIYLLLGQDEREKIDLATRLHGHVVEEDFRAFNVDRLYGGETSVAAVIDAARTLPLMASRRIVIVQQAEPLLQPRRDDSEEAERDAAAELEAYLKEPFPHAVLVLLATELDGRRRLVKLLVSRGSVVACGIPGDADEGATWVRRRAREVGLTIAEDALRLLVGRAGRGRRTPARRHRAGPAVRGREAGRVGDRCRGDRGRRELQDEWAMVRAIEQGDTAAALRELALKFDASPASPKDLSAMILGQLRWMVSAPRPKGRFPRERIRPAVEALFRTDLALKTSAGDPRVLLERLVVELCEKVDGCGSRPAGPVGPARRRDPGRGRRARTPGRLLRRRRGREPLPDPRLVAGGRVVVDDALARHLVDERDGLVEARLGRLEVALVDGRADCLQRGAERRTQARLRSRATMF